jgi:hypothetical protein
VRAPARFDRLRAVLKDGSDTGIAEVMKHVMTMSPGSSRSEVNLGRREFLRLAGVAAATAAGVLFVPAPLRRIHAQGPPARADRILIVNLLGGIRSSAAFHASGDEVYNPWGRLEGSGDLRLGKLLGDAIDDPRLAPGEVAETPLPEAAYALGPDWGGARLPRIGEASASFSVVGTWNERRGDHVTSQVEETTGGTREDAGILTRIHMAIAAAEGEIAVPAFTVDAAETSLFGQAPGAAVAFAPVALANSRELPGTSPLPPAVLDRVGGRWSRDEAMFERLDRGALVGLAGSNLLLAQAHAGLRRNVRKLGDQLSQPWVDVENGAAAFGRVALPDGGVPLTNAMLLEAFVRGLGPDPSDPGRARPLPPEAAAAHPLASDARNLAFGIRLLQLGAPVVVVEIQNFDFHSDEATLGVPLYRALGRWWATLSWLLARIDDPRDPSHRMLERTFVATMSEFGRDPGLKRGFNDGSGSDHGVFPSCYYLAHAVMGAGVGGGRVIGGVETDGASAYDARRAPLRFGTERFLATLLHVLGLDPTSPEWGFPGTGVPITQLWETA